MFNIAPTSTERAINTAVQSALGISQPPTAVGVAAAARPPLMVQIPAGVGPGMQMQVLDPQTGQPFSAVVPPGVTAGMQLQIALPAQVQRQATGLTAAAPSRAPATAFTGGGLWSTGGVEQGTVGHSAIAPSLSNPLLAPSAPPSAPSMPMPPMPVTQAVLVGGGDGKADMGGGKPGMGKAEPTAVLGGVVEALVVGTLPTAVSSPLGAPQPHQQWQAAAGAAYPGQQQVVYQQQQFQASAAQMMISQADPAVLQQRQQQQQQPGITLGISNSAPPIQMQQPGQYNAPQPMQQQMLPDMSVLLEGPLRVSKGFFGGGTKDRYAVVRGNGSMQVKTMLLLLLLLLVLLTLLHLHPLVQLFDCVSAAKSGHAYANDTVPLLTSQVTQGSSSLDIRYIKSLSLRLNSLSNLCC